MTESSLLFQMIRFNQIGTARKSKIIMLSWLQKLLLRALSLIFFIWVIVLLLRMEYHTIIRIQNLKLQIKMIIE